MVGSCISTKPTSPTSTFCVSVVHRNDLPAMFGCSVRTKACTRSTGTPARRKSGAMRATTPTGVLAPGARQRPGGDAGAPQVRRDARDDVDGRLGAWHTVHHPLDDRVDVLHGAD